jgi:parallel beta-helix repeat protein
MVDVPPWGGNYTGTVVRNNTVIGGWATDSKSAIQSYGENVDDVIVKSVISLQACDLFLTWLLRIGIAIGPQTWFGDYFDANVSFSGTVLDNHLTGAFGYGIAITSAYNFTVEGNTLFGNTSFIGSFGPNCSAFEPAPTSAAFIIDQGNVTSSTVQSGFQSVQSAKRLTCLQPPDGGNYWPYGGNPIPGNFTPPLPTSAPLSRVGPGRHRSAGATAGLAVGITIGVIAIIVAALLALSRQRGGLVSKRRNYAGYTRL